MIWTHFEGLLDCHLAVYLVVWCVKGYFSLQLIVKRCIHYKKQNHPVKYIVYLDIYRHLENQYYTRIGWEQCSQKITSLAFVYCRGWSDRRCVQLIESYSIENVPIWFTSLRLNYGQRMETRIDSRVQRHSVKGRYATNKRQAAKHDDKIWKAMWDTMEISKARLCISTWRLDH